MDYLKLELCDVTPQQAFEFVEAKHRHHHHPVNGLFYKGIIVKDEIWLRGVCIVGRPVNRTLDDGTTVEVTRLAVDEGLPNGCSMLYGWARREARKRGYQRLITYILAREPGTSLRAAGWVIDKPDIPYRSWNNAKRPRKDRAPKEAKQRWRAIL